MLSYIILGLCHAYTQFVSNTTIIVFMLKNRIIIWEKLSMLNIENCVYFFVNIVRLLYCNPKIMEYYRFNRFNDKNILLFQCKWALFMLNNVKCSEPFSCLFWNFTCRVSKNEASKTAIFVHSALSKFVQNTWIWL